MSERRRLPNRRQHELLQFEHGGFHYVAGFGRFADGQLAEVFLSAAKSGTVVEAWARDSAIVASIALQHGVPADTIRHALSRDQAGAAASPIAALLDLVASEAAA